MASYDQSASETDLSLLLQAELKALFHVSQVLSRSLNLHETLQGVLQVLHDLSGMRQGMVTLVDPERGDLLLSAVHRDKNNEEKQPEIRYRPGEGNQAGNGPEPGNRQGPGNDNETIGIDE